MGWKWHSPEQIATALEIVRRSRDEGAGLSQAIRAAGVSGATFFRWQALYGKLERHEIAGAVRRERDWRYAESKPG